MKTGLLLVDTVDVVALLNPAIASSPIHSQQRIAVVIDRGNTVEGISTYLLALHTLHTVPEVYA
jgi:hypothetical protein